MTPCPTTMTPATTTTRRLRLALCTFYLLLLPKTLHCFSVGGCFSPYAKSCPKSSGLTMLRLSSYPSFRVSWAPSYSPKNQTAASDASPPTTTSERTALRPWRRRRKQQQPQQQTRSPPQQQQHDTLEESIERASHNHPALVTSNSAQQHIWDNWDTPVHTFESVTDLLKCLQDDASQTNDNGDIIVVKYYADYCRVCKRASIAYKKLATDYLSNDHTGQLHFVRANAGAWALKGRVADVKALGISKFPFVQLYRKGVCVASFSTGASHLFGKRVRDTLDLVLKRTPQEWIDFGQQYATEMEENRQVRMRLLADDDKTTEKDNDTLGP